MNVEQEKNEPVELSHDSINLKKILSGRENLSGYKKVSSDICWCKKSSSGVTLWWNNNNSPRTCFKHSLDLDFDTERASSSFWFAATRFSNGETDCLLDVLVRLENFFFFSRITLHTWSCWEACGRFLKTWWEEISTRENLRTWSIYEIHKPNSMDGWIKQILSRFKMSCSYCNFLKWEERQPDFCISSVITSVKRFNTFSPVTFFNYLQEEERKLGLLSWTHWLTHTVLREAGRENKTAVPARPEPVCAKVYSAVEQKRF